MLEVEEGVVAIEARCGVRTWRVRTHSLSILRYVIEGEVIVAGSEVAFGVGVDSRMREVGQIGEIVEIVAVE